MRKLSKPKLVLIGTTLAALSAFAIAPGVLRNVPQVHTLLSRIQPALDEPQTALKPPRFSIAPPEPDYAAPAEAAKEPDFDALEDNAGHGGGVAGITGHTAFDGAWPLFGRWGNFRLTGAGGAGGIDGAGGPAVAARASAANPQARDTEQSAADGGQTGDKPTDDTAGQPDTPPGQTELAQLTPDDLHNPVNGGEQPGKDPSRPTAQVPEPSALALLLAGLIGLAVCRRRA